MRLEIPDIVVKPYVRMTRRGKFVDKQAQEYLANTADFKYREKGSEKWIVEDVKSSATRTAAFVLRTKLFVAIYPATEVDLRVVQR
jgi:hypothetical protein